MYFNSFGCELDSYEDFYEMCVFICNTLLFMLKRSSCELLIEITNSIFDLNLNIESNFKNFEKWSLTTVSLVIIKITPYLVLFVVYPLHT